MRLFVAIDVSDSIKEHLSYLQRSIDYPGLRLVSPKNIHLTLNFLGEQENYESIIAKLKEISFESFTLKLETLGYFPHAEKPRVIWAGLEDNKELAKLQRSVDLLFTPQESFKPHLTIARFKKKSLEKERAAIMKAVDELSIKHLTFKVNSFKLYKSTLTPLGPVYEVLEAFKAK